MAAIQPIPKNRNVMFTFCYDKKEMEEDVFWHMSCLCFVMARHEKYYVLAYLDPYDYVPLYFKNTLIEDMEPESKEEDAILCAELNPKVIEILTNYAIIELREKRYQIHRYSGE